MSIDDRLRQMGEEVDQQIPVPHGLERRLGALRPPARRPWRLWVEVAAACLVLAALIGVGWMRNRAPTEPTTPADLPVKTDVQPVASPVISALTMVDQTNGWAESGSHLLRTQDGGKHWSDVTPPGMPDTRRQATTFFGHNQAWVGYWDEQAGLPVVQRTRSGGTEWVRTPIQMQGPFHPISFSFIDDRRGWLMVELDRTMNSSTAYLFATSDGGETWEQVARTNGEPAGLPFGGQIRFRNEKEGWVVGNQISTLEDRLYRTEDGGRTWTEQELTGFKGGKGKISAALPFFAPPGLSLGFLAATFIPESNQATAYNTLLFNTVDGGRKWEALTSWAPMGPVAFATPQDGWSWRQESYDTGYSGPVKGQFFRTTDGGRNWLAIEPDPTLKLALQEGWMVTSLQFVNDRVGWALLMGRANHVNPHLLQTTDGGQSWTRVQ